MHVVSRKTLVEFWVRYPSAEAALRTWFEIVSEARWSSTHDIRSVFPTVDFVSAGSASGIRAIFNICGNRFRLIVHVRFDIGRVFVRFLGTHQEYDKVDARIV